MPRHNIRPEVVPLIVEVLKESRQCKGVLSEGPGCYCFEGAVCEAYRRAHPGEAEWRDDGCRVEFVHRQERMYASSSMGVDDWALVDPVDDIRIDGASAANLNDLGNDFPWFIAALEAE